MPDVNENAARNLHEEHLHKLNASSVVVGFARCPHIDRNFCWIYDVTKLGLLHHDGTPRPATLPDSGGDTCNPQVLADTTVGSRDKKELFHSFIFSIAVLLLHGPTRAELGTVDGFAPISNHDANSW